MQPEDNQHPKTHYEVIWPGGESEVKEFFSFFLPQLSDTNAACLCVLLFSRRKYDRSLPDAEYILKRLFLDQRKSEDDVVREFLKLNVPFGSYNPPQISQKSLCIYAMLRPKCMLKSLQKVLNECLERLMSNEPLSANLLSRYQTEIGRSGYSNVIHKTKGETNDDSDPRHEKLRQIDVDSKDPEFLKTFKQVLVDTRVSQTVVCVVETKNGFHIVFRKSKTCDLKTLHEYRSTTAPFAPKKAQTTVEGSADIAPIANNAKKGKKPNGEIEYAFTMTNEPLVIVPGTYQGGFKAKLCKDFFDTN